MNNQEEQKLNERIAGLEEKLADLDIEIKEKNRKLEIEAALEKVRVKATAMRTSSELAETSSVLFQQLNDLQINAIRTGVGIFDEANDAMEIWLTTVSDSQGVVRILDYVNLHIHPVYENIIPARKQNKPFAITELAGNDVKQYYQTMSTYLSLPKHQVYNPNEYFYSFFFSEGAINVISKQALSNEECNVMIRFAQVFGLIYTRFLDLQKAEAQANETLKQTSLDRVRGQIASMRSTEDLQKITPLLWSELKSLGVPFFRCGIFLIDEIEKIAHVYLSAPDGHSLAVLKLSFEANSLTSNVVEHWRNKTIYKEHWEEADFNNWTQSMYEQGQIDDKEKYQDAANAPEKMDLHFIPFTNGMIYVGDILPLSDEEIEIVSSLADTFSIAYARYEDFIQLEKAKQSVESTLAELKATQSQLIQSEKMASLGELTAGIAHEIQNPLNFVNNFSEVNKELTEELEQEIEKGNFNEAKIIANDIKSNEEKIIFHGKRADAIVKGMLQHSRSSNGVKELTDINALADEYLRLAYHGLRAKDKSFNATIKTEFDESLAVTASGNGGVNVIPQDIGRVILNLFTNAFYAVTEKKSLNIPDYEPTVTVRTKNNGNKAEIIVIDNGNGIPEEILDKVFQPFFTTKPTGKGTGLGLSLSFDIVKAHGGDLIVESHQGEGTKFIIQLIK